MGFLDRLLGRKEEQPAPEVDVPQPACPHVALVPLWDSADDIGNADKVARYKCESCQEELSREEGDRLRADEAERVASKVEAERLEEQ